MPKKMLVKLDNQFSLYPSNLREREHFLEILKKQVDDIILPWVADGIPMYWWVPMS